MPESEIIIASGFEDVWRGDLRQRKDSLEENVIKQVPTGFDKGDSSTYGAMLFGLVGPNMLQKGGVVLRVDENSRHIIVEVRSPMGIKYPPKRQIIFNLSCGKTSARETFEIKTGLNKFSLTLPRVVNEKRNQVCELLWVSNYIDCAGPSSCYAGILESVGAY